MPTLVPEVAQYRNPWLQFCFKAIDSNPNKCSGLLFGHIPATAPAAGLALANCEVKINSVRQAIELFGPNSIMAKMVEHYYCQCGGDYGRRGALFVVPLVDIAATAPEYTYTLTGTATQYGVLAIELPCGAQPSAGGFGNRGNANCVYTVNYAPGDTAADMATALAAVLAADPSSLWTVADDGVGGLTFVSNATGTWHNGLELESQPILGYSDPDGVTSVWAQTVVGAGIYDIAPAIAKLSTCCHSCFGLGFDDGLARQALIDEIAERWDCNGNNCLGHGFAPARGDFSSLYGQFEPSNDAEITIIPLPETEKYPAYIHAAAWAGRQCCYICNNDDAGIPVVRELGKLECMCASQECGSSPFTRDEMNELVFAGVAAWDVDCDGFYTIQNNVTNYKRNIYGGSDDRWTETATRYVAAQIRDLLQGYYTQFWANHKIKRNGTELNPGSRTATATSVKAHLIGWLEQSDSEFANNIAAELFDDVNDNFADNLVAKFNPTDCNRLDIEIKAPLTQPLMRISTCIEVSSCAA